MSLAPKRQSDLVSIRRNIVGNVFVQCKLLANGRRVRFTGQAF
jgi:hypothetical protein